MKEVTKERIYLDKKLDTLPDYYDRDIVKVLTKNLNEVYVFWGVSSKSFNKILNAFECLREEVYFKLVVTYMQEDKVHRHREIFLPPFTNNWFLNFEKRIKNLKVEVVAYTQAGKIYSLLHSAEIVIPSHKPSKVLHKEWINPSWVQQYNIEEVGGEVHIIEGEKKVNSNNTKEDKYAFSEELEKKFFIWPDGSSGFMGSSGLLSSASNQLRKSNEQ